MSTSPNTLSSDLPCLVRPQASSRSSAVLREGRGLTRRGVSSGRDHRVYGTDLSALNTKEEKCRTGSQSSPHGAEGGSPTAQAPLTPVPPQGRLRAMAPGSCTALIQNQYLAVGHGVEDN